MEWNTLEREQLVRAMLALRTPDEARRFFRDLMTEAEITEFANRLRAAALLAKDVPYSRIRRETGLSATTIARVSKWLQGTEGGYRLILGRIHHHATNSRARGVR